jgi:hypothetical protein
MEEWRRAHILCLGFSFLGWGLVASKSVTWETENSQHRSISKSHFIDLAVKIFCVQILKDFPNGRSENVTLNLAALSSLNTCISCTPASVAGTQSAAHFLCNKMWLFLCLWYQCVLVHKPSPCHTASCGLYATMLKYFLIITKQNLDPLEIKGTYLTNITEWSWDQGLPQAWLHSRDH